MNKTAIILSREEALALPIKKRPICFRISGEIYTAVFEHIGQASMCWRPRPVKEVFDPEEASKVAVDLCFMIANEVEAAKANAFREAAEIADKLLDQAVHDALIERAKEFEVGAGIPLDRTAARERQVANDL